MSAWLCEWLDLVRLLSLSLVSFTSQARAQLLTHREIPPWLSHARTHVSEWLASQPVSLISSGVHQNRQLSNEGLRLQQSYNNSVRTLRDARVIKMTPRREIERLWRSTRARDKACSSRRGAAGNASSACARVCRVSLVLSVYLVTLVEPPIEQVGTASTMGRPEEAWHFDAHRFLDLEAAAPQQGHLEAEYPCCWYQNGWAAGGWARVKR